MSPAWLQDLPGEWSKEWSPQLHRKGSKFLLIEEGLILTLGPLGVSEISPAEVAPLAWRNVDRPECLSLLKMPKILWCLISASQHGFQTRSLSREINLVIILCILEVCVSKRASFLCFSLSDEGLCDGVNLFAQRRDDCLIASVKWWVGKAIIANQTSDAVLCSRVC